MGFPDQRAPSWVLKDVSFLRGQAYYVLGLGFSLHAGQGISHHNSLVTDFGLCWCRLGPQSLSENVPDFRNEATGALMGSSFAEAVQGQSLTLQMVLYPTERGSFFSSFS